MRLGKPANIVCILKTIGLGEYGEGVDIENLRVVPVYNFEEYAFGADDAVEREVVAHLADCCLFEA